MSAAATIAALRAPFVPSPNAFEGEDKDLAVKAWNRRQGALAAIEANGTFFDGGVTSPEQSDLFDTLEEAFRVVDAETLQGIAAKLWVALSHLGPSIVDSHSLERQNNLRVEHDAVRRADIGDVASFIKEWDFGEEVLFSAIIDLERMARFEPVSRKASAQ